MDLLHHALVGPVIGWRHLRRVLQLTLRAAGASVVLHGLFGPQIAPRNLATVLTSIHWRGLLLIALLAFGNLFCASCPMMLVRDAGRRVVHPRLRWPRALRTKWLGLGLLVVALASYEWFDLWELPRATAWIVLGYFGVALAVDLLFAGASFCKYLCPVGQFDFVASTVSPTQLEVRDISTCRTCRTSDCIKGRYSADEPARLEQRGCELGLFLPAKVGNLDCTMCFDCVRACPHDNIALATRVPGVEWLESRRRSGLGRLDRRVDIAALALVFTFGALLSALAMTPASSPLTLLAVAGLALVPVALLSTAASLSVVYALVPFGFGVWLAHYGFHLFTGVLTVVPVTQSAAIDLLGWAALGEPAWR